MGIVGRKIHFMGAGGIGVSALVQLAKHEGAIVSACDREENEMTELLSSIGVDIKIGHDASHLDGIDELVFTSAIKANHPERLAAEKNKIPSCRRGTFLAKCLAGKKVVGVCGTHGKTTTSCILGQLLQMCGKDPTVILGGVQAGKESNLRLGESNIVAVELDESDGSFLEPDVELAVITNIEPDHLDYYRTEEAVVEAFEKFAASASEKTGIVACVDDERTKEFGLNYNGDFLCVGTKGFPRLLAHDIKVDGFAQKFSLDFDGNSLGEFCLNLPGEHNIKNALCAMAAAFKFGCPWEELQKVLPMCKGVARRFDIIGEVDGVVAVDDYAHHPTEISACISAARSVHNGRLIAVFQPHLYSRTKFLCDEFADALCTADEVVLVDVYAAREEPEAGVGSSVLAEKIKEKGRAVYGPFGRDKTAGEVKGMVASGDMVLFIGAGDVGKCAYEFVG